jgi:hypothetical protein
MADSISPPKPHANPRLNAALQKATNALLAERCPEGHWTGHLSSSALSTATAVIALTQVDPKAHAPQIRRGLEWLVQHSNPDGGWGDTVLSKSNISTTALGWAAFGACDADSIFPEAVARAAAWLEIHAKGRTLVEAITARYGKDHTFSVPILMVLALSGRLGKHGWKQVPALPFELATLPRSFYGAIRLPVVSYAHGTTLQKDDVPSKLSDERYIGVAFATAGYAAALPDYLGLGDSPGFHPYHHAESEATATIDLLRATRSYCASNNIPLSDKLFLTGYSQGGHACLATLRELEAGYTNEFHVAACAAGAGAYDLSGTTLTDFLSNRPQPDPYSFVYLLAAYQDIYGLTNSFASMLSLPYATNLPPLLNGLHDGSEVNALLPPIPKQILQPAFLNDLTHNTNNLLRVALGKNDLIRWTPQSRLRLYRCSGDTEVPIANSQVAYDSFVSRGALHVELKDPSPGASHVDCAIPTAIDALKWFDSLRK